MIPSRIVRGLWITAIAAATGCLSEPSVPADAGSGSMDAATDASAPDAGPPACVGTGAVGPGLDFPPGDVGFQVRLGPARVADLNCDGLDDLIVANVPPASSESWGVFVLLGRGSGVGTKYDAFVPTGVAIPRALHVGDVVGDGQADIAVYGHGTGLGAWLIVFEGETAADFADDRYLMPELAAEAAPEHGEGAVLAIGDVSGDGVADVVTGTQNDLWLGVVQQWRTDQNVSTTSAEALPGPDSGTWRGLSGATVLAPGTVLARDTGGTTVFVDGIPTRVMLAADDHLFTAVWDDATVFGTGVDHLSAIALPAGPARALPGFAVGGDGLADGIAVAQLDGDAAPDVVVLDARTGTASRVVVARNVRPSGAELAVSQTMVGILADAALVPTGVVTGDFDGDGVPDLVVYDEAGAFECLNLQLGPPDELARCD